MKILETPSHAEPHFDIVLSYRTKDKRLLTLEVISTGILNNQRTEFKYSVAIAHRTEVTQTLKVKVHLRDSLVYLENKALNLFSDLYIEELQITVMLLDLSPGDSDFKPVLAGDFKRLPLTPPWNRPQKPGFSFKWPWEHVMSNRQRKIAKCRHLNGEFELHFKSYSTFFRSTVVHMSSKYSRLSVDYFKMFVMASHFIVSHW